VPQPSKKQKQEENRGMVPVTFKALPSEIMKWKESAKLECRTLSNWLRLRLTSAGNSEEKA